MSKRKRKAAEDMPLEKALNGLSLGDSEDQEDPKDAEMNRVIQRTLELMKLYDPDDLSVPNNETAALGKVAETTEGKT